MSDSWPVLAVFAGSFSLGLTGAMPPGPMFAATVMHARRWGWRAGVLVSSGHGLLEVVMVAVILAGAGAALARPMVVRIVAVAGGVFLAGLGAATVLRPPEPPGRTRQRPTLVRRDAPGDGDPAPADGPRASAWWRPLLAGVWTSASQPYWFGWWAFAGAGAVLAVAGRIGPTGVAAFYVGHVLADFAWFTFVAAAVGAGRSVLSERAFRRLFVACGVALVGFGVLFVALGIFFPGRLERERPPAGDVPVPGAVEPDGPT